MVMEMPSPQCVGQEFVRQYYTLLHEAPNFMHRFYSHDSSFVHGGIEKPGEELPPVMGQADIHKKIMSLNFRDCHAKIRQVDSQATIDNAVVVQVVGELSNAGQPMRRFMQTFVLAPQSPKKYYVHNDIFRYQDEVFHDAFVESETDIAESGNVSGCEETVESQIVLNDNGDQFQEQQLQSSGSRVEEAAGVCAATEPALAVDAEIVERPSNDPLPSSDTQPVVNCLDNKTEKAVDAGRISVASDPSQLLSQLTITAPTAGSHSESPAIVQQPQQAAAVSKMPANNTQKQPVEVKAPEPAKQVSWAALASKGTSAAANPVLAKPQATVKPEVKPEAPTSNAPLPQRAPRVDRSSVDRESTGGGGGGNYVSSGDSDDYTRRGRHPDNLQVFVGNLPHNVSEVEMKDYFEKFGPVTDVRINRRPTRDVPNFGFVVFESADSVQKVLGARPLYIFDDKYRLNVEEKKQQSDYRSGGGAPRGIPRGGFRGSFSGNRGGGGRGGWRGGRGARGGSSGFGASRSSDDDNSGDDRNYERAPASHLQ